MTSIRCLTAVLAASMAVLSGPVVGVAHADPDCRFSGGSGPDSACASGPDNSGFDSPWLFPNGWPNDDGFPGFGVGFPGPGRW